MLRLDLLRDLDRDPNAGTENTKASGAPEAPKPEGSGAGRRVLLVLAILLVAGAGLLYLSRSHRLEVDLDLFGGKRRAVAGAEAARADSLQAETVRAKASRAVDEGLALSIEWLNQLETLPAENRAWTLAFSSFTSPNRFVLKGSARTAESISAVQEALVLFPGADLTESRADAYAAPGSGYAFAFSGDVSLVPQDSVPAVDRTLPASRLDAELDSLRNTALAAGIRLDAPQPGAVSAGGGLEARSYRISGNCDSVGVSAIRTLLETEQRRGSPFGVRRVTLENREGRQTVFLDIMAFTR